MARKPKNDAPPGGWETPAVDGRLDPRPPVKYAAGVKKGGGWIWKPVDQKYWDECAALQAKADALANPAPTVRVRTRTRK